MCQRKGQPKDLFEIARRCDLRLNRKFARMTSRGKRSTAAAVTVARELMGFIWAVGQVVCVTEHVQRCCRPRAPVLERRVVDRTDS
jgi:hypothetical protein